jgi:hypothetical protein
MRGIRDWRDAEFDPFIRQHGDEFRTAPQIEMREQMTDVFSYRMFGKRAATVAIGKIEIEKYDVQELAERKLHALETTYSRAATRWSERALSGAVPIRL